MHLHQFQDTSRQRLDPTSQLYQHHDVSGGGQPAASTSHTMMGASSQFDDFQFSYSAMSNQPVMVLPEQTGVDFDGHQPGHFAQTMAMPPVPSSHSMTSMAQSAIPGRAFITAPDSRRDNAENSDAQGQDKTSPAPNSVDDSNTEEFGLSGQNRGDGTDLGGKAKDDSAAAPPAWSELKTKAGKDRKRLPLACIACRRKKIRCSGEKPACKHCMRSRIPCVYKVNTRKAAPRTDYMAMLDKRLKRMEERIIKILPKSDMDSVSAIPRAVVKPAIPGTGTMASNKPTSKKRNADDAFGSDLEAWAKAPRPKLPDDNAALGSPGNRDAEESELFKEGIDVLPPKDVQEHLAEVYFDYVYGQSYQLLHKPSYMRKLKYGDHANGMTSQHSNGALPPVLVLSVCAIAARFASSPKFNSDTKRFMRGEEWASRAREICTKRYDWPNITILTCLLILGMHEFGTCHGGRAWALGGQAIRMAFALHLHKDLDYDPQTRNRKVKLSFIDREIRRRVMWGCFLMDRFNSSGTDRPMFIKEETIRTLLPVSEKRFQYDMPAQTEYLDSTTPDPELPEGSQIKHFRDNLGISAFTIRSIAMWGRIIAYINQGGKEQDLHPMWSRDSEFAQLVQEAENLLATLPNPLTYNRENLEIHRADNSAHHYLFLHMAIQQNLLFLNQAAVTLSQQHVGEEAPKDFVPQASAKTLKAANKISDCLRDTEETQCNITAPFAGYCAFSSTAIHITGMFSGNPAMKATAEANSGVNVRYLRKMMNYWGLFHWMVDNIRTQFRTALDAARSGGPTNGSTASSPILQYSDWFNRYPHGVSDTDYMDPALSRKKEKGEDGVLEQKAELQTVGDFFTAVGSAQSGANNEGAQAPSSKRKSSTKKQTATSNKQDQKTSESIPSDTVRQHSQSNNRQRGFSTPIVEPTSGPPSFDSAGIPQSQQPFAHFSQTTSQADFFGHDSLAVTLDQQADGMMQLLDGTQMPFGFGLEPGGLAGSQHMMNVAPSWASIPASALQADAQMHSRQNLKANGLNGTHPPVQGQISHEDVSQFRGQDSSPGWFMSMEGSPDMTFGVEADPFAGLFGGGNSGMPISNQHRGM